MSLGPGDRLEPYEIVAPLGAGGMGEVYRALDPRLGREVAIKVLPDDFVADSERLRRFEDEARTVSSLNHPNVLTIYDVGLVDGAPFLVFELLEGRTLRELLTAGVLPRSKAVDLGSQLCRGLAAAHRVGVVHRDLKPENLFVTDDGRLKILDFGLAKLVGSEEIASAPDDEPTLAAGEGTEVGAVLGTVGYMAPEQVQGETADRRSDIFAAGAVMHEMMSGYRAFEAPTRPEILTAILRSDPRQPIPDPVLDRIVRRCLEKRPEERFQSAEDVAFALEALSDATTSPATSVVEAAPTTRSRGSRTWLAVGALVVAAIALAVTLWRPSQGRNGTGSAEGSGAGTPSAAVPDVPFVLVLPLTNLSGDPSQEYFADGMTEALITDLTGLSGLRTISRTSAMRYKGVDKPLTQIAEELGVQYVLAGTALQVGDRVRISVELVDAGTDQPLWADRYERGLSDVLGLQSEVSKAIARATQLRLTPEEERRLETQRRVDPIVHELYLKGRFLWHKRTPDALREALGLFQEAVELDPEYAPGHLGVALTSLVLSAHTTDQSQAQAYSNARVAAEKALDLDPELAEGHLVLAEIALHRERDWARAEAAYRRALELNPGDGTVHYWYTELLVGRGEFEEALREIDLALEIDPLSPVANLYRGTILFALGREDEALRQLEHGEQAAPGFYAIPSVRGLVLAHAGRCEEARAASEAGAAMSPESPAIGPNLAYVAAYCGDLDRAADLLESMRDPGHPGHSELVSRAMAHSVVGEFDNAFDLLRRALDEPDSQAYVIANDRALARLRSDPRFHDLVEELGLPMVALPSD